jgi:hypothetical protein
MTKPETMRWKTVSVKKPARASETKEALVFGARLTSSSMAKEPHDVVTRAV